VPWGTPGIILRNKMATDWRRGYRRRWYISGKASTAFHARWPCRIRLHLSPPRQRGPCWRGGL